MKRTHRKKTRGQALVEFALVFPIIMLVIFGIIDFGWMIFNYAQLYNGMREALRFGSVAGFSTPEQYKECQAIRQRVIDLAGLSGVKQQNITIKYDNGDPAAVFGACPYTKASATIGTDVNQDITREIDAPDRIFIDIEVTVPFLTPFIRPMVPGGGIPMSIRAARTISFGLAGN